jgi:hypothetical protein
MIWDVDDAGRVEVRMRAEGAQIVTAKAASEQLVQGIVQDLDTTLGIQVTTDELRFSFSKTRPEVTVSWRTVVPSDRIDDVRAYLTGLAETMQ